MLVYQDLLTGDELLSDSFLYREIENGILWEVEGKWVTKGACDVDIGANPSAEGGEEDEGVDYQAVKVVDIVDTFRLQEQPSFDKKQFVAYVNKYINLLTPKLEGEQQELFKKNIEGATKFLLSKLKDLQIFVGESMHDDSSLVFAYTRMARLIRHSCTSILVWRKSSVEKAAQTPPRSNHESVAFPMSYHPVSLGFV